MSLPAVLPLTPPYLARVFCLILIYQIHQEKPGDGRAVETGEDYTNFLLIGSESTHLDATPNWPMPVPPHLAVGHTPIP